jgi:hypothetical protein
MGWINYLKMGKQCYDIITDRIPPRLEDGVLTVDEMANIIKEICAVFGIKAEIKVPSKYTDKYFDIVGYDETISSH